MRELALFAGAGGGILGGEILGWRTVCAVEYAPYPRKILLARQRDGILPKFPIWDDVRTFDGRPWRGRVDVVSGGFPCQAFSQAARGRNNAPDLWPEMLRVSLEVRPRFVFAENVKRDPIERAAGQLEAEGWTCSIAEVSAAALGAPHIRERWWLLGDAHGDCESMGPKHAETSRLCWASEGVWPGPEDLGIREPDRMADRVDRLRACGNGQVPAVVAAAWRTLGGPC